MRKNVIKICNVQGAYTVGIIYLATRPMCAYTPLKFLGNSRIDGMPIFEIHLSGDSNGFDREGDEIRIRNAFVKSFEHAYYAHIEDDEKVPHRMVAQDITVVGPEDHLKNFTGDAHGFNVARRYKAEDSIPKEINELLTKGNAVSHKPKSKLNAKALKEQLAKDESMFNGLVYDAVYTYLGLSNQNIAPSKKERLFDFLREIDILIDASEEDVYVKLNEDEPLFSPQHYVNESKESYQSANDKGFPSRHH
jgi:hypothetical protein